MSGVLVYLPAVPHHEAVRKELAPGDTLSFGRGTPCHNVGLHLDNPTVPRLAGEILAVDDHWRLSNFSTDRTYEVIPSSSALVFEGKDRLDHSGHAAG